MESLRWTALLWAAIPILVSAQSISPANTTFGDGLEQDGLQEGLDMAIARGSDSETLDHFPVAALTSQAQHFTPNNGFGGDIVLANASTQLALSSDSLALISCDPYTGNIQPSSVFGMAQDRNVSAIVLYSEHAQGCSLSDASGDYDRIYTMPTTNATRDMLDKINSLGSSAYGVVAPRAAFGNGQVNNGSNGTGSDQNQNQQNPLGPSPSTAVAMIILYSITGVITALFLVIIITGAVRAHRHPERYGPRNGVGRPRQSRARGLARAMLDTIPIVKTGDRQQDPKQSDVELAGGQHGQVEVVSEQDAIQRAAPGVDGTDETPTKGVNNETMAAGETSNEGGIGGAVAAERPKTPEDHQGCSICTEDFQVGEDQRVLPCDHRFHPACIDPWLLNVSGTCPLCRIDLRPEASRASQDGELNEHGEPALREGEVEEMAPPLAEQGDTNGRRASVRRSIMLGVMGIAIRPERMTREERVEALRQYRAQQNARRVAESNSTPLEPVEEEETSVRRRLRNAFRIRTSRTGQGQEEEGEQAPENDPRRQGTFAGPTGRA